MHDFFVSPYIFRADRGPYPYTHLSPIFGMQMMREGSFK
jgi:hypothetical protein